MMKKSFEKNGMKFVVKYDWNSMIYVNGYEKHFGLWWLADEDGFWIDDYETIEEGVEKTINRILEKYGLRSEQQKKLQEYFK